MIYIFFLSKYLLIFLRKFDCDNSKNILPTFSTIRNLNKNSTIRDLNKNLIQVKILQRENKRKEIRIRRNVYGIYFEDRFLNVICISQIKYLP